MQDTFADRLNALFDRFRPPVTGAGRLREFPDTRVAELAGFSHQHLSKLRDGASTPGMPIAQGLAHAFAELSAEVGEPVARPVLLSYLVGEVGPEALEQPSAEVVRLMARQGDLREPGIAKFINDLLDDLHREPPPERKTWLDRLKGRIGL